VDQDDLDGRLTTIAHDWMIMTAGAIRIAARAATFAQAGASVDVDLATGGAGRSGGDVHL
jgi:hypothetical protein